MENNLKIFCLVVIEIILSISIVLIGNNSEKSNKKKYELYALLIILYGIGGFGLSRMWYLLYIGLEVDETLRIIFSTVMGYFSYLVIIGIGSSIYKLRKMRRYF